VVEALRSATLKIAEGLQVVGLINVQFAVRDEQVFVLEANPRASRTVPFVAKATGVSLAQAATRIMLGESLNDLRHAGIVPAETPIPTYVSVKEAVLPFNRFPGVDTVLGPEMRSTGEVMGIGESFGIAFAKAQLAAGTGLPRSGRVFLSLSDRDKTSGLEVARSFLAAGFELVATTGTAEFLQEHGLMVSRVVKKYGAMEPGDSAVELIADGFIQLVVNTPSGSNAYADGAAIRRASTVHGVPCLTTLAAAQAAVLGIAETKAHGWRVTSLQELHQ